MYLKGQNMMSCTRLYVYSFKALKGPSSKLEASKTSKYSMIEHKVGGGVKPLSSSLQIMIGLHS